MIIRNILNMSKLFIIVSCCFFILMLEGHQCYSSEKKHDDHSSHKTRSPRGHGQGHHQESHPSHSSSSHGHHQESHPSHSSSSHGHHQESHPSHSSSSHGHQSHPSHSSSSHGHQSHPSHSSSSHGHQSQRHSVKMPSGAVVKISDPVLNTTSSSQRCGKPTMVRLNPSGKFGRQEYPIIAREMHTTKKRFEISKIQKIVHPCAWREYTNKRSEIKSESGFANETMLFYGTSESKDLVEDGFGKFDSNNGDLGDGFYLTEHLSNAHKYSRESGQLLLCRVSLGKVKSFGYKGWRLDHPPHGYNSVRYVTKTGFSPYFVVYNGEQIYPEYLITYSADSERDFDD